MLILQSIYQNMKTKFAIGDMVVLKSDFVTYKIQEKFCPENSQFINIIPLIMTVLSIDDADYIGCIYRANFQVVFKRIEHNALMQLTDCQKQNPNLAS